MTLAMLFRTDEWATAHLCDIQPTVEGTKRILGGEFVPIRYYPGWHAYVRADAPGLPTNPAFNHLIIHMGHPWFEDEFIPGPVLVLGDDRHGIGDIPDELVTWCEKSGIEVVVDGMPDAETTIPECESGESISEDSP